MCGLSLKQKLIGPGRLVGPSAGVTGTCHHAQIFVVLRILTQAFTLMWQALTN